MPDAYLCVDLISPFESNILSADEWDEYDIPTIAGTLEVTDLDLVASFDHGNRTAEELMLDIIALAGDLIMARVLILCGLDVHLVDCFGLAAEEFHVERDPHSGLWHTPHTWDPDWFQHLHDFCTYEIEPMLGDCGFIVEQSGDAGMTWVYAPSAEQPGYIVIPQSIWED